MLRIVAAKPGRNPPASNAGRNLARARDEHEQASRALKDSQALHRALADNPVYGVCQFDPGGRLLDANQVLVDMLGYESKEELLRMNIASDVTRDPQQGAQLLETYRRTGQVATPDAEWKRKDGTPLIVRLGGRHVENSGSTCELIAYDVTADRAHQTHLQHLALTDALTGLANYRQFKHAVEAEAQRSARTGRPFAVLLFDLDALKGINDRYGHVAGNRALCRLSATLRGSCRFMDTAARYGGDEFAVVLPETGVREAGLTARRICVSLACDREDPQLSISVGIAVYPHNGISFEALLQNADLALYRMKADHRRVALATRPVTARPDIASRRHTLPVRSRRRPITVDLPQE